jgi:GntR family transcriptional regulator
MLIRLDSSNGTAIWQQIVHQVTRQVMSGNLEFGDRLPTVRELAADLRINPNTAARAYQDLERDGIVETRRGAGTFVCDIAGGKTPSELKKLIEQRFDEIIVEALHVNLNASDLLNMFQDRLEKLVELRKTRSKSLRPGAALISEGAE